MNLDRVFNAETCASANVVEILSVVIDFDLDEPAFRVFIGVGVIVRQNSRDLFAEVVERNLEWLEKHAQRPVRRHNIGDPANRRRPHGASVAYDAPAQLETDTFAHFDRYGAIAKRRKNRGQLVNGAMVMPISSSRRRAVVTTSIAFMPSP